MVHQVLRYWSLALLLASATAVAQRPDTCVVWTDMFAHELAGARGWVRIEKTVPLAPVQFTMVTRPRTDTADAQGRLYLHLLRNSVVYMWSRYGVLGLAQGAPGTPVVVPDADSARLETLIPAQSIPSMYLVATRPVRVKYGADSALVNSILFSGTGVSVGFDSWTATVDISAGAGDTIGVSSNPMFTNFETDIAALLDSIVVRYGQVQAWTMLQGFLTSYTETDPVAAPLAATAQDTATQARLEVAAHAGRADNPHSVTASQIGAATTAALEAVEDTAQVANKQAWTATTKAELARDTASLANRQAHTALTIVATAQDTASAARLEVLNALLQTSDSLADLALRLGDTATAVKLWASCVFLKADTASLAVLGDLLYARSGGGGGIISPTDTLTVTGKLNLGINGFYWKQYPDSVVLSYGTGAAVIKAGAAATGSRMLLDFNGGSGRLIASRGGTSMWVMSPNACWTNNGAGIYGYSANALNIAVFRIDASQYSTGWGGSIGNTHDLSTIHNGTISSIFRGNKTVELYGDTLNMKSASGLILSPRAAFRAASIDSTIIDTVNAIQSDTAKYYIREIRLPTTSSQMRSTPDARRLGYMKIEFYLSVDDGSNNVVPDLTVASDSGNGVVLIGFDFETFGYYHYSYPQGGKRIGYISRGGPNGAWYDPSTYTGSNARAPSVYAANMGTDYRTRLRLSEGSDANMRKVWATVTIWFELPQTATSTNPITILDF